MDKEEAKFVLQSFRPDGADAIDPAFAEALAVAAADREVGDWLAHERAADAAFAEALNALEIPEDLRESILAVLAGEAREEFSEMDAVFVGALASVRPPEGLRDQILAAMKMEQKEVVPMKAASRWNWKRPLALAAAVVLGAFVAVQMTGGTGLNAHQVERLTIEALGSDDFALDTRHENPVALVDWLKENGAPAPMAFPAGLSREEGIGCKILPLNDTKAAMICFKLKSGQVVHMVTLDREDVAGVLSSLAEAKDNCHGCKVSGWSSVAWSSDDQAFVLIGKMKPEELAAVF
jgi:hypothetical protein